MYWDASGALVLDYAVSPDYSGGVPSWWEEHYGQFPDLTFNLPWRYSGSRGLGAAMMIFNPDKRMISYYSVWMPKQAIRPVFIPGFGITAMWMLIGMFP